MRFLCACDFCLSRSSILCFIGVLLHEGNKLCRSKCPSQQSVLEHLQLSSLAACSQTPPTVLPSSLFSDTCICFLQQPFFKLLQSVLFPEGQRLCRLTSKVILCLILSAYKCQASRLDMLHDTVKSRTLNIQPFCHIIWVETSPLVEN
jgi:hypothetical protein